MAATTDIANLQFDVAIRMSSHIREIVQLSKAVNLVAINAILIAKRVGDEAVGFSAAASELRRFSDQLNQQMQALVGAVHEVAASVADLRRKVLRHEKLARARAGDDAAATELERSHAEWLDKIGMNLHKTFKLLRARLQQASNITRKGVAVAQTLKIEAAGCGAASEQLKIAAASVDETLSALYPLVGALAKVVVEISHDEGNDAPRVAVA